MSTNPRSELTKVYDPSQVESVLYAKWQQAGYFQPSDSSVAESYTVVLPPPNITGRLHMGHALTATIEDCLVRWHRMRGYSTLWIPGSDHAGIATQVMVERELAKEGTNRHNIGRSAFTDRVWEWQKQHGGIIDDQHRRLGASLDWTRYRFTMDDTSSGAVREAFCRLYEQGLIYRDYRLINWDYGSQTALSDLEVEHREVQGKLWHIAYPVENSEEKLVVATTRPETMLGDSAVAVHPDDPRYGHLIGKFVILPLSGRKIPIVGDSILVDMSFGTGAVKVTPAHDFNDFETGKRHRLEMISVIDLHGKMCAPVPASMIGLSVEEARSHVLSELKNCGALIKSEEHKLSIGYSQRTGVVVEPLPSFQWFVNVKPMAELAIEAVKRGQTTILPSHRTQDFYRWMENIHDWCVSRQLWWGHQIPAWYCRSCEKITVSRIDVQCCQHCNSTDVYQDPDVLDTWFSSGLWPLTTLGWPKESVDFSRFYPTSLMETGWDILFFWVARMMMFGLHFTGKTPFTTVYLHSMVLGEDGQKMSKTKGNVVDPITMIDQYGVDALRFYLCTMAGQESGIVFSRARVEGYRNFCNKLWNVSRFALMNLDDFNSTAFSKLIEERQAYEMLSAADRWILARATQVASQVNSELQNYRLDLAAHALYQFVWSEFCDWYIEIAKLQLRADRDPLERDMTQGVLVTILDIVLRLLHPIMPFITEVIWTQLPRVVAAGDTLMLASYPQGEHSRCSTSFMAAPFAKASEKCLQDALVKEACVGMQRTMEIVTTARMLRSESRINPSQKIDLILRVQSEDIGQQLGEFSSIIVHLARLEQLSIVASDQEIPKQAATSVVEGVEIILPLADLIDLAEERNRLKKSVGQMEGELASLTKKLANPNFLKKAPAAVVQSEQERLKTLQDSLTKQIQLLERLI